MIPVMCVVQEGQIPTDVEYALRSAICNFVQRAFGALAEIDWIEVPKGSGFTAAKPSTAVIASLQADRSLIQTERISLLKELSDIFIEKTGRSPNEVVIAIRSAS